MFGFGPPAPAQAPAVPAVAAAAASPGKAAAPAAVPGSGSSGTKNAAEAAFGAAAAPPGAAPAAASKSSALVVATKVAVHKPKWQNVDGFPNTTFQLERRKLNNFADLNSYSNAAHSRVFRPLDCKGELGAGPVQRWKEMLREGSTNDRASTNYFNAHLYDGLRAQELYEDGHFINQLGHLAGGKDYSLAAGKQGFPEPKVSDLRARAAGGSSGVPGAFPGSMSGSSPTKQPLQAEHMALSDPMAALFERYAPAPTGSARGSARKTRTPRGGAKRAASASRARADGSSPFLKGDGLPGQHSERRARSASPGGGRMLRNVGSHGFVTPMQPSASGGGLPGSSGGGASGSREGSRGSRGLSADAPRGSAWQSGGSGREGGAGGGRDAQFSFWGGRQPPSSHSSGKPASERAASASSRKPGEHPRTRAAREAHDRALILARARGRSPTRWGPAGERKLAISQRPAWRNVTGFPDSTVISEHRKLNNFADINSYSSTVRSIETGFRPLDCKGENGARPVQQWKEMLRGGPGNNGL